jgi:hypothetical protein
MKRQVIGAAFLISAILLLIGCGMNSILDIISDKYPLADVVESSTNSKDTARVFAAENQDLSEVSSLIQSEKKPDNVSEAKDDKQVLIYDDYFVTLTKDEEDSNDTIIEVASHGFVRDNYSPDFFDGLIAYYILSNLFNVNDWSNRQSNRCINAAGDCYKGYNASGGAYKGPARPSSFRGSLNRGGGPGAGK